MITWKQKPERLPTQENEKKLPSTARSLRSPAQCVKAGPPGDTEPVLGIPSNPSSVCEAAVPVGTGSRWHIYPLQKHLPRRAPGKQPHEVPRASLGNAAWSGPLALPHTQAVGTKQSKAKPKPLSPGFPNWELLIHHGTPLHATSTTCPELAPEDGQGKCRPEANSRCTAPYENGRGALG